GRVACLVGVLDTQLELPAMLARIEVVEDRRSGGPNVHHPGGRWRDSSHYFGHIPPIVYGRFSSTRLVLCPVREPHLEHEGVVIGLEHEDRAGVTVDVAILAAGGGSGRRQ